MGDWDARRVLGLLLPTMHLQHNKMQTLASQRVAAATHDNEGQGKRKTRGERKGQRSWDSFEEVVGQHAEGMWQGQN